MTSDDMKKMGVAKPEKFWPIQLTRDGLTLIAAEDLVGSDRQGGVLSKIWVLRFRPDGTLEGSRNLPLRTPRRLQNCLTPDEKGLVVLARQGASFWYVDLATGEAREFIHSGMGITRFVSDVMAMWSYQGTLWTIGYTVDPQGVHGPRTVVALDPTKQDAEAIRPTGMDIVEVYRAVGFRERMDPKNIRIVSPELAFLGGLVDGTYKLQAWRKGAPIQAIATLKSVTSMLGMGNFIAATAKGTDGSSVALIHDAGTGKTVTQPKINGTYNYPFISEGGESYVVTQSPPGTDRVSLFYGHPDNGYALKPLADLQNRPAGVIRLSADGSHFVFRNQEGLFYGAVPK